VKLVQPRFKNLTLSFINGGHAVFGENESGMVEELTKFVLRVTVCSIFLCDKGAQLPDYQATSN
jgi:hypothetical protein